MPMYYIRPMFWFTGGRGRPALVRESPKKFSQYLKTEVSGSGFLLQGLCSTPFKSNLINSDVLQEWIKSNHGSKPFENMPLNQFNPQFKWTPKNLTRFNSRITTDFRNLNQFEAQLMIHWSSRVTPFATFIDKVWFPTIFLCIFGFDYE